MSPIIVKCLLGEARAHNALYRNYCSNELFWHVKGNLHNYRLLDENKRRIWKLFDLYNQCWLLSCFSHVQLCDPKDCSLPGSSVPGDSPGKTIGVGCHALLQGIFLTQGLNPRLLHCRGSLHYLSHQGSPRILDWVAYPFTTATFRLRNQTRVSCIAGWCFTSWATRES